MREVLDTSAFFRLGALTRLRRAGWPVIVPAVAFTERARQLAAAGVSPETFIRYLSENQFPIERYGRVEATRRAVHVHDEPRWRRLARDAMIAGHVRPGDRLWTTNPRDFIALGIPPEQVMDLAAE